MNSEELLKKYKPMRNEFEKSLTRVWIRFSVFKKNVLDCPPDAEVSAKKVMLYLNIITNEIHFHNNNEPFINLTGYWNDEFCYAKYLPKYNCIAISLWMAGEFYKEIDLREQIYEGKGPFKLSCAKPKLINVMFLCEDKQFVGYKVNYDYYSPEYFKIEDEIGAYAYNRMGSVNYEGLIGCKCPTFLGACKQMFNIGLLGGNKFTLFADYKQIAAFLKHKEPQMRDTPKQKLVNELLKVKLSEPTLTFDVENPKKLICVASKVNEEYSALRWFMKIDDENSYEISRLYVNKKTHIFCRKNSKGDFIVLNNKLMPSEFDSQQVVVQDADAFDGTKLEYFTSIYKTLEESQRSSMLYMLTVYPEFERMYKGGMKKICDGFFAQIYQRSWNEYLRSIFGSIDMKQKTLQKMFGFSKYQLDLIQNNLYKSPEFGYFGIGVDIKEILSVDDCSSIDPATFEAISDILVTAGDSDDENVYCDTVYRRRRIKQALSLTINAYSLKVCLHMIPKIKEIASQLTPYIDYINMVVQMDATRTMRPQFDTFEDIQRMHDDVVATYRLKRSVAKVTQFKDHVSKWKQWEYDDDDKFVVIAPTKPEDLAVEGLELHHCVKSYIERVANGSTNILFIRSKEEPEKPFFTVEVSNLKTIEQVHGFGNRNIDTEPDLDKFVDEWAKNKKLKCNRINKIR